MIAVVVVMGTVSVVLEAADVVEGVDVKNVFVLVDFLDAVVWKITSLSLLLFLHRKTK